jgi:hypothetical protein
MCNWKTTSFKEMCTAPGSGSLTAVSARLMVCCKRSAAVRVPTAASRPKTAVRSSMRATSVTPGYPAVTQRALDYDIAQRGWAHFQQSPGNICSWGSQVCGLLLYCSTAAAGTPQHPTLHGATGTLFLKGVMCLNGTTCKCRIVTFLLSKRNSPAWCLLIRTYSRLTTSSF